MTLSCCSENPPPPIPAILRTVLITFTFPPPLGFLTACCADFVPFQLLEYNRPPARSCSVMQMESDWPPDVEANIATVRDIFPPRLRGARGFVMLVRFAFVLKLARFPMTLSELIALLLIWYRLSLYARTIMFAWP